MIEELKKKLQSLLNEHQKLIVTREEYKELQEEARKNLEEEDKIFGTIYQKEPEIGEVFFHRIRVTYKGYYEPEHKTPLSDNYTEFGSPGWLMTYSALLNDVRKAVNAGILTKGWHGLTLTRWANTDDCKDEEEQNNGLA